VLDSIPVIVLAGSVLGFLSGLGIGGGTLLILWLTLVVGVPSETARAINLMFFVPCALIACLFRWKQGRLDIKKVLPAIIAGSIASGLFTFLSRDMDTTMLRKLFGGLLIVTGLRELLYRPKKG
jgi:uncharacterized membrane protein YfcA